MYLITVQQFCLSPSQMITTFQRNILQHCWVQHVACVWSRGCDVLRPVGCCWLKFETGQIFHPTFVEVAWCYSRLIRFMQLLHLSIRTSSIFNTQHVAKHHKMPAKCAQHVVPNNVAICCAEMLWSFGQGLQMLIIWPGLYMSTYCLTYYCVVPENIYTSPTERTFSKTTHLSGSSSYCKLPTFLQFVWSYLYGIKPPR